MSNTIADLIRQKAKEKAIKVRSQVDETKSLYEQVEALLANDAQNFQRLGVDFRIFSALSKDLGSTFNSFLAEPLLRECSLLLDRCLQERKEYQELHTKWFEALIQIDEMFRLSDITEKETDEVDAIQTKILNAEIDELKRQSKKIEEIVIRLRNDEVNDEGRWNQQSTELTGFVEQGAIASVLANGGKNGQLDGSTSFDIIKQGVHSPYDFQRKYQRIGLLNEENYYSSIKQSAEDAQTKTSIQIELKDKTLEFKRLRNDIARMVAIRREEQLTQTSGALNFLEQMKPLADRFANDLTAAYLRISAANKGFHLIYGDTYPYYESFNKFVKRSRDMSTGMSFYHFDFDELVTWTQLTNTWLASFLDNQQQVTRSFSLGQLLSEQGRNFNDGLATGKWQFKLSEEHFYNSKFVRLRGFAIQVDSGHFSGSWNIAVTPPTKAKIRREKDILDIDQKVGTLYLGRVNETTFQVVPEAAAPPKLYNASPIGQDIEGGEWTIEIKGMSTNGDKPPSAILDIDIHLTVALV